MYLFFAIPNFCGSTLMHSLIETSPNVAALTSPPNSPMPKDFSEGSMVALGGYNLHGPHSMEVNMEHAYSDQKNYNWPLIKKLWHENWANSNPYAEIHLQKTTFDYINLKSMCCEFPEAKWILSVRNPYAYVESIFRKATFQMEPMRQLDQVVYHAGRTLEIQRENVELLGDSTYVMTYEDFAARPEFHCKQIVAWMPELMHLDPTAELMVKGKKQTKIYDDSDEKFAKFVAAYPDIVDRINEYLMPFVEAMDYWGYPIRQTELRMAA